MVIRGEPVYADKGTTTVTNPMLIAEVLPKSTQNYDQGDKFTYYRSIPEMEEYLLIDQTRSRVMQYRKTEQGWLLTDYESENSVVRLGTVGLEIGFGDLYEGVNFDEQELANDK